MSESSKDIESVSSEAPQRLNTDDAKISDKIKENESTTEKLSIQDDMHRTTNSRGLPSNDTPLSTDETNVSKSPITSDVIKIHSNSMNTATEHKEQGESVSSNKEACKGDQPEKTASTVSNALPHLDANDTNMSERDKKTSKGPASNRKPSLKFPGKLEIPKEKQLPTSVDSPDNHCLYSFEDKPETRFDEIDDDGSVNEIKKDRTSGFVLPKNLSKTEQKSKQEQSRLSRGIKDEDTKHQKEKQTGVDDSGADNASTAPKVSLTEYLRKTSKTASSSASVGESDTTKDSSGGSRLESYPDESKIDGTYSSSVAKNTSSEVKVSQESVTSTRSLDDGNEETSVKSEHEESTSVDKKEEKPFSGGNQISRPVRLPEDQVPTSPLYDNIADSSYLSPVADQPVDNTFLENMSGVQEPLPQHPPHSNTGYGSSHEDNSEAETDIADSPPRINIPKRLIRKKDFDENRKALFANKTRKEEKEKSKGSSEKKSRSSSINEKPYKIKRDSSGSSLLQRACKKGLLSDVKRYIERGASPNECDFCGFTCLHEAALEGHTSIVKYLIEKGADVNKQAEEEGDLETPLIDAAENKHLEIVRILLENGADPRIYNINGFTALTKIFNEHQDEEGYDEIISLLEEYNTKFLGQVGLKEEVEENGKNRRIPAPSPSKILEDPNDSYFSDLINKKTNSAAIYKYAAEGIKEYTANYFIEGGRLDYKPDILLLAARNGHLELVDIILGLSAGTFDINQENNCGLTALLACVGRGHYNVTEFLLSRGANPHKRRRPDGLNALQIAERAIRFDVNEVRLLQEYMGQTLSGENSTESESESNDEAVHSLKKADPKTSLERHPKRKQKVSTTSGSDEIETKVKKDTLIGRQKSNEKEKEEASKKPRDSEKASIVEWGKGIDTKLKKQTSKVFAPEKSPSSAEESKMAKPSERSFSPMEAKDSEVIHKMPERSPSQSPVPLTKEQEEMKAKTAEEARLWQEKVEAKKQARKNMFLKLEREKERKKKEEDAKRLEEEKRKEEQKKLESQQLEKLREQKQEQLEAEKESLKRKLILDSYPAGLKRIKLGPNMSGENTLKFSPLYQYDIDGRWYVLDLHIALLTGLSLNLIHDNVSDKNGIKSVDSVTKTKLWRLFYPMIGVDNFNLNSRSEASYIDGAQKFGNLLLHFIPTEEVENMTKRHSSAIFHEIWELDRTSKVDLHTLAPFRIGPDEPSLVKQDETVSSPVHVKDNLQTKIIPPHFRYRKDILRVINNALSPLW